MSRSWADLQDEIEGQALPGTLAGTYLWTGVHTHDGTTNYTGVLQQGGYGLSLGAALTIGAKAVSITEAAGTGTLAIGTESFLFVTA